MKITITTYYQNMNVFDCPLILKENLERHIKEKETIEIIIIISIIYDLLHNERDPCFPGEHWYAGR